MGEVAIPERPVQVPEQLKRATPGVTPSGNRILDPDTWAMFAQIANTIAPTNFVPKDLRGDPPAVMACMMFGHALNLHPSVALTEVSIIEGRPTLSASAMAGKIREAGHRIRREEIRDADENFLGARVFGARADNGEEDVYSFTLEMAARAGLMTKNNWQKYPEAMCWARGVSQLARFLFSDVFLGQSVYTAEELGVEETDEYGAPAEALPSGSPAVEPEPVAAPAVAAPPAPATVIRHEDGSVVGFGGDAVDVDKYLAEAGLEQTGYEEDVVSGQRTIYVRPVGAPEPEPEVELEPGEQATLDAAKALVNENIPPVMAAVSKAAERGDWPFIEGVLHYELEKGDKARQRLLDALRGMLAGRDEEEDTQGAENTDAATIDAMERDAAEEHEPEPQPEPEPAAASPAPAPFQPDPEPEPEGEMSPEAKIVRLRAACAWIEDQLPQLRHWRYEGVIASGARQWGVQAHTFDDFEEWQLDEIWNAVPAEAKQGLALVEPAALEKLAGQVGPK